MQSMVLLMLVLPLALGLQVDSGCEEWTPHKDSVCCSRCKPGNRFVSQCGKDPKALCEVCGIGTYVTDSNQYLCQRCAVCPAPLRVKQPCTASSDTVCECVEGFRCGDGQCSFCVKECGKGEEPAKNRGCQPCPEGKFNDKIHHVCVSWSSGCPSPQQKIIAHGTAVSDIVCGPKDDPKTTTPFPEVKPTWNQPDSSDYSPWTIMAIAAICALLILFSAMLLIVVVMCKSGQKLKTDPAFEASVGWNQTPDLEQCSFCFPQEEQGSGSEESLVSDDKPFELVV